MTLNQCVRNLNRELGEFKVAVLSPLNSPFLWGMVVV